MKKPNLLHLGCGPNVDKSDWIDCDGSWNALINCLPFKIPQLIRFLYNSEGNKVKIFPKHIKYVNLHKQLPFQASSIDAIYASHVWEHLYYEDGVFALNECYRVCKPGGYVRLVVPDLYAICKEYVDSQGNDRAHILHNKLLYRKNSRDSNVIRGAYTALTDFHTHKFMYDVNAMVSLFLKTGFENVSERSYLDSDITAIEQVESNERIGVGIGFAVEARKPIYTKI